VPCTFWTLFSVWILIKHADKINCDIIKSYQKSSIFYIDTGEFND
jgi:hypothetical protein